MVVVVEQIGALLLLLAQRRDSGLVLAGEVGEAVVLFGVLAVAGRATAAAASTCTPVCWWGLSRCSTSPTGRNRDASAVDHCSLRREEGAVYRGKSVCSGGEVIVDAGSGSEVEPCVRRTVWPIRSVASRWCNQVDTISVYSPAVAGRSAADRGKKASFPRPRDMGQGMGQDMCMSMGDCMAIRDWLNPLWEVPSPHAFARPSASSGMLDEVRPPDMLCGSTAGRVLDPALSTVLLEDGVGRKLRCSLDR